MKYYVGVDIGGTKCAVVLGKAEFPQEDVSGFLLDRLNFNTNVERGPAAILQEICYSIDKLLATHQLDRCDCAAMGVSCGGPLNHKKGIVMNPPNLSGWNNVPVVQVLKEHIKRPVYLQNDANACALAEWRFGAARGCRDVIFLTFGTGMGAGLILDGRIYNGTSDMAGEVGHIRLSEWGPVGFGKAGSLEGFCSGGGISRLAQMMVTEQLQMGKNPKLCPNYDALSNLTAKSVAEAAEGGDPLAQEIYQISGRYLGRGIALLVDVINPEMIVIGSIYERSQSLLLSGMQRELEAEALAQSLAHCRIVPAMLGNQIGDYAALSVALQGENHDRTNP